VEFLNSVANETDPFGLYSPAMASIDSPLVPIGFERFFELRAGFANKPVNQVSFYDALRFVNWMHNGQGNGDTETGAYTLVGGTPTPSSVLFESGATLFLPSENEWYKAAYYDPSTASYFDYPAGSDIAITCSAPEATPKRELRGRRREPDGRRCLHRIGQPVRHLRPGRQRLGMERTERRESGSRGRSESPRRGRTGECRRMAQRSGRRDARRVGRCGSRRAAEQNHVDHPPEQTAGGPRAGPRASGSASVSSSAGTTRRWCRSRTHGSALHCWRSGWWRVARRARGGAGLRRSVEAANRGPAPGAARTVPICDDPAREEETS
jgi:hypothetical protein